MHPNPSLQSPVAQRFFQGLGVSAAVSNTALFYAAKDFTRIHLASSLMSSVVRDFEVAMPDWRDENRTGQEPPEALVQRAKDKGESRLLQLETVLNTTARTTDGVVELRDPNLLGMESIQNLALYHFDDPTADEGYLKLTVLLQRQENHPRHGYLLTLVGIFPEVERMVDLIEEHCSKFVHKS